MPLADLITSVSASPAQVLGLEAELGRLEAGREADITVLHLADLVVLAVRVDLGPITTSTPRRTRLPMR